MYKKELRQLYKAKRLALAESEVASYNAQLLEQYNYLLPKQPIHLLTFAPITKWKEPNVNIITAYLQHEGLIASLSFPKINEDQQTFNAITVDDETHFSVHNFDINEPQNGRILAPKDIDAVFIPLLAFDLKGYRVGYGKGMYDKYLEQCKPDVLKIGFSFFSPIESISDIDAYDIPLDYCITPEKCYTFR